MDQTLGIIKIPVVDGLCQYGYQYIYFILKTTPGPFPIISIYMHPYNRYRGLLTIDREWDMSERLAKWNRFNHLPKNDDSALKRRTR